MDLDQQVQFVQHSTRRHDTDMIQHGRNNVGLKFGIMKCFVSRGKWWNTWALLGLVVAMHWVAPSLGSKSIHGTVSNQVFINKFKNIKRPELTYPNVPSKTNTKIWYYNCLRVWACSYQSQLQIFHGLLATGLDPSWLFPYSTL